MNTSCYVKFCKMIFGGFMLLMKIIVLTKRMLYQMRE